MITSLSSLMQQVIFSGDYHYYYQKLIQRFRHKFIIAGTWLFRKICFCTECKFFCINVVDLLQRMERQKLQRETQTFKKNSRHQLSCLVCRWLFGWIPNYSSPVGQGCFHEGTSYCLAQRSQPLCALPPGGPIWWSKAPPDPLDLWHVSVLY